MKTRKIEEFYGQGHENVQATHRSTIEITKEDFLTKKGNCIIGVNAQKGCFDLGESTKEIIRSKRKLLVILKSDRYIDSFIGFGHEDLTLNNLVSMVFRKSNYICDRTVMVNCNKSAHDLDRDLVKSLQNTNTQILIEIYAVE